MPEPGLRPSTGATGFIGTMSPSDFHTAQG